MTRLTFAAAGLVSTLLLATIAAQTLEADLQRASQRATTTGDQRAAIQEYERIVARAGTNHAVAAQALLRMAEAYQTIGDAQARGVYERIVREYPDQTGAVAEARARMGMGTIKAMSYSQVWMGPKADPEGTVSMDGRYLSFPNWDTGNLELHDFSANSDRPLTNSGTWTRPEQYAEESAISRDGTQVAYSWYNTDGRYDLRVLPVHATGFPQPRRLYDNPDVTWIGPYDWSPDGKWIAVAFGRRDNTRGVGLVPAQGGQLVVVKETGRLRAGGPQVSPDSRFMAFELPTTASGPRRVVIVSIPDGAETQTIEDDTDHRMMGWSPDGSWLLFTTDGRGTPDLWAMRMANGRRSGEVRLLKPDLDALPLGVTRAGALFVGTTMSQRDVSIAPIDLSTGKVGGAQKPIARFFGSNRQADWSADGRRIAYLSTRKGTHFLAIRDLASGATSEHLLTLAAAQLPRWSPDGRSLLLQGTDKDQKQGIFRVDAATGTVTSIKTAPQAGLGFPQWHADGKRIFYRQRVEGQGSNATFAIVEHDLMSGATRELVRKTGMHGLDIDRQGRRLVTAWNDGTSAVAGVVTVDTGAVRELARFDDTDRLQGHSTAISPDGTSVLIATREVNGEAGDVQIVPLDGSARRSLGLISRHLDPQSPIRISPDGRSLAYVEGGFAAEVWKLENFLPSATDQR